jgi:hypothetical protein
MFNRTQLLVATPVVSAIAVAAPVARASVVTVLEGLPGAIPTVAQTLGTTAPGDPVTAASSPRPAEGKEIPDGR